MKLSGRTKNTKTDSELLAEFKSSGSVDVLTDLYLRYSHLVLGVCYKYLKDSEQSKDMAMQVFEKLIVKLPQFEVSNFSSWLHSLVRNECLMELRKKQLTVSSIGLPDDDEKDSGSVMELHLADHPREDDGLEGDLTKLENCIERLNDEQRLCVQLFFIQEKCYKEISDESGYDLKKVKSYIQNGKRNLKICMESGT